MTARLVTRGSELGERLSYVVCNLEELKKKIVKSGFFQNANGTTSLVTRMQALSSINWQNPTDQLIYSIIIDHCIRAEKAGPGSFPLTLGIIIEALKKGEYSVPTHSFKSIAEASFVPTHDQLQRLLMEMTGDDVLGSVVLETLDITGIEGKVFFEASNNETLSIEQINGFNFSVNLPFPIVFKEKDVKIVIVDGFVENVSEIHHLLQKFSETKEPLVLVCRGFADDVLNTMRVNFDRKTLKVMPVSVKFDFDGVNTLADIAVASCSDVVSSLKGQLFSSIKYDEIKQVPMISLSGNALTIVNDNAVNRAQVQVQHLLEKRKTAEIEDLARLYDARIKSLTPSCTKVRVPSGRRYSEYSEGFDIALRLVRSAIKRGMLSKERLGNEGVFSQFPDIMTVESAVAALQFSKSCFRMLNGTQAVIV